MKKRIPSLALALGLCALLLFSACGSKAPADMPPNSIYDKETSTVLSLGDPKSKFDEVFGESAEAEYGGKNIAHAYLDGSIKITLDNETSLVDYIYAAGSRDETSDAAKRVVFYNGLTLTMSQNQLENNFDAFSKADELGGSNFAYELCFDENQNLIDSSFSSEYYLAINVNQSQIRSITLREGISPPSSPS